MSKERRKGSERKENGKEKRGNLPFLALSSLFFREEGELQRTKSELPQSSADATDELMASVLIPVKTVDGELCIKSSHSCRRKLKSLPSR